MPAVVRPANARRIAVLRRTPRVARVLTPLPAAGTPGRWVGGSSARTRSARLDTPPSQRPGQNRGYTVTPALVGRNLVADLACRFGRHCAPARRAVPEFDRRQLAELLHGVKPCALMLARLSWCQELHLLHELSVSGPCAPLGDARTATGAQTAHTHGARTRATAVNGRHAATHALLRGCALVVAELRLPSPGEARAT